MAQTGKQKRFNAAFMMEIHDRIDSDEGINNEITNTLNSINEALQSISATSQVMGSAATVIGVASVLAAPPTLGISLAAACTAITGLTLANAAYLYFDKKASFQSQEIMFRNSAKMGLEVFFEELGCTLSIKHSHFINEKATNTGIETLAKYAAMFFTNYWLILTRDDKPIVMDAFLEKIAEAHVTTKHFVEVEKQYQEYWNPCYAEGVYSRSSLAFFNELTNQWSFYASAIKSRVRGGTLNKYGYISLPSQKQENYIHQFNLTHELKQETNVNVTTHLWRYYLVSKEEVIEYLQIVLREGNANTYSLNDHLSQILGINVIAECHNDKLQGVDLSEGNFSEVNFRRADLRDCKLKNTLWHSSHIECAQFGKEQDDSDEKEIQLNGARFEEASATGSFWNNVNFIGGDFFNAKMRGLSFDGCIRVGVHEGSNWDFCEQNDTIPYELYVKRLEEKTEKMDEIAQEEMTKRIEAEKAHEDALKIVRPMVHHCITSMFNYEHLNKDRKDLKAGDYDSVEKQNQKREERENIDKNASLLVSSIFRGYINRKTSPKERLDKSQISTKTLLKDGNTANELAKTLNRHFGHPKQKERNQFHYWNLTNFLSRELSNIGFVTPVSSFGRVMNDVQNSLVFIGRFFAPSLDLRQCHFSAKGPAIEGIPQEDVDAAIVHKVSEKVISCLQSKSYDLKP